MAPRGYISFTLGGSINSVKRSKTLLSYLLRLTEFILPPPHPSVKEMSPGGHFLRSTSHLFAVHLGPEVLAKEGDDCQIVFKHRPARETDAKKRKGGKVGGHGHTGKRDLQKRPNTQAVGGCASTWAGETAFSSLRRFKFSYSQENTLLRERILYLLRECILFYYSILRFSSYQVWYTRRLERRGHILSFGVPL